MANYTYECPECENQIDVMHKMLDNPTYLCEKCKVEMFKRAPTRVSAFNSSWDTLYNMLDKKFRKYKAKKKKQKQRSKS